MCAIFGNAIDNAIEAVERLSDSTLKEIQVKIGISDQIVFFRFHNYFDGTLKQNSKQLLTRKSKEDEHGYGLKNIRRLAEKYGGTAAYDAHGKEFTLTVMLPLPNGYSTIY